MIAHTVKPTGKRFEFDGIDAVAAALKTCGKPTAAIVGGRERTGREDRELVFDLIDTLAPGTIVVTGGARGVDTLAQEAALALGHTVLVFPARWDDLSAPDADIRVNRRGQQYDAKAGFRRNKHIVQFAQVVYALPGEGGGTYDTMQVAHDWGRPLVILREQPQSIRERRQLRQMARALPTPDAAQPSDTP